MLVSGGDSLEDAIKAVNESNYAVSNNISVTEDFNQESSVIGIAKQFPGLAQIFKEEELEKIKSKSIVIAKTTLIQNSKLLNNYWSSINSGQQSLLIYTLILGFLAILMELFIAPQFEEIYMSFGAELPGLTQFLLINSSVLFSLLFLVVLLNILTLIIFRRGKACSSNLSLLPKWMLKLPLFRKHLELLNQCILLSLINFAVTAGLLSEIKLKSLAHFFSSKHAMNWWEIFTDSMSIAKELNLEKALVEQELESMLEQFSTQGAESIKIILLMISIIVFGFIGALVIAMYLPIFQLGAIV